MTGHLQLKFTMPSDPRYLPVVRGAIAPLAAAIGWDESDCRAITGPKYVRAQLPAINPADSGLTSSRT